MTTGNFGPLIDTLTPEQVSAFLLRKNWSQREYPNPNLTVFQAPAPWGERLSLVLPAKKEFADFAPKLRDCIVTLSDLYETDAPALVQQIAHWDRDVISVRLQWPDQREQLPPLTYAADILHMYRDFLAFAAATEVSPRRFFARMPAAGRDFADICMFGHTYAGSFGLSIECPLDLDGQQYTDDAVRPRPFRRAVTERVATAYADMASAARENNPDIIVRNQAAGFTGNMCDILVDIHEMSGGHSVSQRIIWAPELRPPDRLIAAQELVSLDERTCAVLKTASAILHTVDEPEEDKTIIGRISTLRSDAPPLETSAPTGTSHTVIVLWEFEHSQVLRLHIELPVDQYREALDAHKNGRKIRVLGRPRKEGKYWWLKDHHDFGLA